MIKKFTIFAFLLSGALCVAADPAKTRNIHKVESAIEKTLAYMEYNTQEVTLDCLMGIVILKANLNAIRDQGINIHDEVIRNLLIKTNGVYDTLANRLTKIDNKNRLQTLKNNLLNENLWRHNMKQYKKLTLEDAPQERDFRLFTNYMQKPEILCESDKCIWAIINTNSSASIYDCFTHIHCRRCLHERKSDFGYTISHRLLIVQLARQYNCKITEEFYEEKVRSLCTAMRLETDMLANCNSCHKENDIFLEQVTLCGMEGFVDFLTDRYLNKILRMQDGNGCFLRIPRQFGRWKRNYIVDEKGCVDHANGLGLAALGNFLRLYYTN